MQITKQPFGITLSGECIFLYELQNKKNVKVSLINLGAAVQSFILPDKNGSLVDIVLGYDNVSAYEKQDKYLGVIAGRCANRIEKGRFCINHTWYQLACNDGNNHLHGGITGFDKQVWAGEILEDGVKFTYQSKDGEEGYPGNLDTSVIYRLSEENALIIEYSAVSDTDTVCNLTNHSYFNLNGHHSGSILDQYIQIHAHSFTYSNKESLPTGVLTPVQNTPLDFTKPTLIGSRIEENYDQLKWAGGYDQNWVIDGFDGTLRPAAHAYSPKTGISLEVFTTLPGLQFYTGNYLFGGQKGKRGAIYENRSGFCLESQFFPNAMAHSHFLKPILKKGELYHQITIFQPGQKSFN